MTLAVSQRDFCAFLRDMPSDIVASLSADSLPGLAVYHHAFRAQLRDCLVELFERSWAYLGDDAFHAAAAHHMVHRPPANWTLDAYGTRFHISLAELYPEDGEVTELAWIEWALRQAFSGSDAPPLTTASLGERNWDAEILQLHPTVLVQRAFTNAATIWTAIGEGVDPPPAALLAGQAAILVWRQELTPQFRTVAGLELEALDRIGSGMPFGQICEIVFGQIDPNDAVPMIGAMLSRWLDDGLLVDTPTDV